VAGRAVVDSGACQTLDEGDVLHRARAWREKIHSPL
jgi:hypothetical protein